MEINSLYIDIRLKPTPNQSINKDQLISEIKKSMPKFVRNARPFFYAEESSTLYKNIDRILVICQDQPNGKHLECKPEELDLANYFIYATKDFGALAEEVDVDNEGEGTIGSFQWELPTAEFEGLWEGLVYGCDGCPKKELLNFIQMTMEFARHGVNPTIIPQNRIILLNGPPGTGKTTLCKAIAQRMSIRMQNDYKRTLLVEVNSHSLFSKWFSESGKLIQKLFTRIEELAERLDWLIFVLIDEVESLTIGREASISGNDPTDSVRAVNAVLTQLDRMKRHPNVFILCTSNIEKALDPAFIDRVGLIRHIGHPEEQAIEIILENCVEELTRAGLLLGTPQFVQEIVRKKYQEIALSCSRADMSGRTLCKLPGLAFSAARQMTRGKPMDLATFLDCLQREAGKEGAGKVRKQPNVVKNGISLDGMLENLPPI